MPHPGPEPADDLGQALESMVNAVIGMRRMRGETVVKEHIIAEAGINSNAYYKIARGDSRPQYQTVINILRAIGMTPNDFEDHRKRFGRKGRNRVQESTVEVPKPSPRRKAAGKKAAAKD